MTRMIQHGSDVWFVDETNRRKPGKTGKKENKRCEDSGEDKCCSCSDEMREWAAYETFSWMGRETYAERR